MRVIKEMSFKEMPLVYIAAVAFVVGFASLLLMANPAKAQDSLVSGCNSTYDATTGVTTTNCYSCIGHFDSETGETVWDCTYWSYTDDPDDNPTPPPDNPTPPPDNPTPPPDNPTPPPDNPTPPPEIVAPAKPGPDQAKLGQAKAAEGQGKRLEKGPEHRPEGPELPRRKVRTLG